jgi:serine/threonine-protein kinase
MVDGLLFRRRLSQLGSEPIPGTEGASEPFFSPDGRSLGFFADGRLRRLPMGGGPPVTIAEVDRIAGASWGDNDVIVYSTNLQSQLFTVPANGGTPSPVPNTGPGGQGAYHPAMLPGGTAVVAALGGSGNPEDRQVGVVDLESGAVDTLATATRITYASGHVIFSGADGTVLAQPFDPGARETTGPAVAILDGVGGSGPNLMGAFAVSDAGSIAYRRQTSTGSESLVVRGDEGSQRVPLSQAGNLEGVSFSNDARRIAMQILDSGIWIWDRDQLTHELLVPDGRSAVWTPDGERVAFSRTEDSSVLEWMPSDGSGSPEVLYDSEFAVGPASFTPGGKVLAFRSGIGDDRNIGFLDVETGEIRWFVEDDARETQPIISPDGRWVAYTSNRSGRPEVYVRAFDGTGGRTQISAGGGHSPRWHPDGDGIYYVQLEDSGTTLASIEAGDVIRVLERSAGFDGITDLNLQGEVNWDISPDGSEYVFIGTAMETTGAPEFVWVLNWPELVRGMAGSR